MKYLGTMWTSPTGRLYILYPCVGKTTSHITINFTNYSDIVELLLSYEASCNSADDKGSSPLHLAAWAGHAAIVEILLTRGPSIANVNLTVRNDTYLWSYMIELFLDEEFSD